VCTCRVLLTANTEKSGTSSQTIISILVVQTKTISKHLKAVSLGDLARALEWSRFK